MNYLVVAIFAVFGGLTRYQVSLWVQPVHGFPLATLTVNLVGCFLLAIIIHYIGEVFEIPTSIINGMGTGFVGAMTTFSTFSNETLKLLLAHQYFEAVFYDGLSVFGGIIISLMAIWLSRYLVRMRNV